MNVKPQWVKQFRQEASNHLHEMRATMGALQWQRRGLPLSEEAAETEDKHLRQLFLNAHSVKGTAGMLGMDAIVAVAAELETLWGEVLLNPALLSLALRSRAETRLVELAVLVNAIEVIDA